MIDSLSSDQIKSLIDEVVSDILNIIERTNTNNCVYTTYDRDLTISIKQKIVHAITDKYIK